MTEGTCLDILEDAGGANELLHGLLQGAVQLGGGAAARAHRKQAAVRQRRHAPRRQPDTSNLVSY